MAPFSGACEGRVEAMPWLLLGLSFTRRRNRGYRSWHWQLILLAVDSIWRNRLVNSSTINKFSPFYEQHAGRRPPRCTLAPRGKRSLRHHVLHGSGLLIEWRLLGWLMYM